MNVRYIAWLVAGAAAFTSFAHGDTPSPAPAATPAADAEVQVPASPTTVAPAITPAIANPTSNAPTTTDQAATQAAPVALPDPIPGDSVTTVLAALGKPNGVITLPDKYLMMFDRGNVVVSLQDVVLETKLMPLAEYTAKLAEQVAEENDRRNTQARANALLDLLLNDPSYVAMTTRDRLLALAKFDREHPGSDAHQDYLDLLAIYAAEQATSAKVADYQNQAAAARAQAIYAQQQAASVARQLQLAQQQTAAAQQQAAVAQQQAAVVQGPAYVQQSGVVVVGNSAPPLRPGGPTQRPPPAEIINGNSVTNLPPPGMEVILPNGTIKYIPGNNSGSGNHTTYF